MYAKNFAEEVTQALLDADKKRMWLLDAFEWSVCRIKEIRQYTPGWSQEWFASEIQRILNVNPWEYSRTVRKLGGGKTQKCVDKGRALMERFGVYECYRAERLLTNPEIGKLREMVDDNTTKDGFKTAVADIISFRKKKNNGSNGSKTRGRKAYLELLAENKKLRSQVKDLKEKLNHYKEKLKRLLQEV